MIQNTDLVQAWILAQRMDPDGIDYEQYSWAADFLINSVFDNPEKAFETILAIIASDSCDQVLSSVGAGPLEDLIVHHGSEFIERIEVEAKRSPAFRSAVSHVWMDDEDGSLKNRIQEIGRGAQ